MKLRTSITLLCCLAIFLATVISDVLIWSKERKSLLQEVSAQALADSYTVVNNYLLNVSASGSGKSDTSNATDGTLKYFFREAGDEYTVYIRYRDNASAYDIYNHTVYSCAELLEISKSAEKCTDDITFKYVNYRGSSYIVHCYDDQSDILIFHFSDISSVSTSLQRLAAYMAVITLCVMAIICLSVFLVMRSKLKLLDKLTDTAGAMASGDYSQRVTVYGKNEIALLATAFNDMAEAVETRTYELEESEQKTKLFMANFSHELKTPLAAISGYAQTLLEVKLSDDDRAEALIYIDKESRRVSRLSRKLMRLLELDKDSPLELTTVPSAKMLDAAAKLSASSLKSKNITLTCSDSGGRFMVDEDLMTEVLTNLIDNAARASRQGSSIELTADDTSVSVTDHGCGIPEEDLSRILEPFYMVDKSRSRKCGGAGLGLSLVAAIIDRHGGTLEIESAVGKGTRITIHLQKE